MNQSEAYELQYCSDPGKVGVLNPEGRSRRDARLQKLRPC